MAVDQQARRQPLVHEYLAEQLRREIALGLFSSRRSLPPERELAAMFGVGIMTVHRAIRLLEAEFLITSRRGRGGGTFIVGGARDDGATEQLQARARRERQRPRGREDRGKRRQLRWLRTTRWSRCQAC